MLERIRSQSADTASWYFAFFLVANILLYLWPITYLVGHRHWLGLAVILFNLLLCLEYNRRYSRRAGHWGFSWTDFLPGLKLALGFTTPVLLGIFLWGQVLGTFTGREHPLEDLFGLFLWALAQQFALQTVIFREVRRRWSDGKAITAAALIFSLIHLPNPFLVPLTFAGAWLWCWVFERHPNLIPLALSHSLGSLTILASLPQAVTGSMRVGVSYLWL